VTEPTPAPTPDPQSNDGGAPPSGFTPPASQEELNRIIGERVTRERAKFSDYSDLKAKAARVDELEGKASEADAAIAEVPSKVAAELRTHLVALHKIDADDADLFLTASDPTLLLKQVERLVGRGKKTGNHVPREGATNPPPPEDEMRQFARSLFDRAQA
jgi:hypothetical protein